MIDNQNVMQLTDERWQAITHSDKSFDDIFIYAVKSTGICCRPSCKSRNPKKENVRIFNDVDEALSEGFRPCKRCKPGGLSLPDEEWTVQIKEYINANYHETLSLEILADMCHGSPFHLQRTFKRVLGLTPSKYIQQVRISNAMIELSANNKSIADVGFAVGLLNTPYFITLFKKHTGQTPKQYQKTIMEVNKMKNNNESIVYWTQLNYGQWTMHIAATTEGLCYVGSQHAPFEELSTWVKKQLPSYVLSENEEVLEPYAMELIDYFKARRKEFTLPMDLHGTAFQQSVWKILREISYGKTVSYTDIAEQIQKPNAVRAVGTAIGANPVLITIPCHRVIAKSGSLTGYRGGLEMKEQLLGLEKMN